MDARENWYMMQLLNLDLKVELCRMFVWNLERSVVQMDDRYYDTDGRDRLKTNQAS